MVKLSLLPSARGRIIAGFGLLVLILAIVVAGSAWLTREHRSAMTEMQEHIATTSLLQDAKVSGALGWRSRSFNATSPAEMRQQPRKPAPTWSQPQAAWRRPVLKRGCGAMRMN